jgi:hypothetical protein
LGLAHSEDRRGNPPPQKKKKNQYATLICLRELQPLREWLKGDKWKENAFF